MYITRNRPILEYACQLWHPGLTQEQSECLDSIPKRGIKIIYKNIDYQEALTIAGLPTVQQRRMDMVRSSSFKCNIKITDYTNFYLLKKENCHCLRKINQYETINVIQIVTNTALCHSVLTISRNNIILIKW